MSSNSKLSVADIKSIGDYIIGQIENKELGYSVRAKINANFYNLKQDVGIRATKEDVDKLKLRYYETESALKEDQPSPNIGDRALVGVPYPGTVWGCKNKGIWYNTGIAPTPEELNLAEYAKNGGSNKSVQKLDDVKLDRDSISIGNLLNNDLSAFFLDKRLGEAGNLISNNEHPQIITSHPISVTEGQAYSVSGACYIYAGNLPRGIVSSDRDGLVNTTLIIWQPVGTGYKFIAPFDGYLFVDWELDNVLSALKYPSQVELGEKATEYKEYGIASIRKESLPNGLYDAVIMESYNRFNVKNTDFAFRYSPASESMVSAAGSIYASTEPMFLNAGQWTFGPDNTASGGFFANSTDLIAESNISFIAPVTGNGRTFIVPEGGRWIRLNLRRTEINEDKLAYDYQLEKGEIATAFQEYKPVPQINPNYLPAEISVNKGALDLYTSFGNLGIDLKGRLPRLRKHWIAKDKDILGIMDGTSLTARGSRHNPLRPNPAFCAPLFGSYNWASYAWEDLSRGWNQIYWRFDSGKFTETGNWLDPSMDNPIWDDATYREDALTRVSEDTNATLSVTVPEKINAFRFIYRSDSQASEYVKVSLSGGNGLMETLDRVEIIQDEDGNNIEKEYWVEANGHIFSMREPDPTILPSITYTDPKTGEVKTINNYQTKGNTTFQKRKKFRCKSDIIDSRDIEKTITFSFVGGTFPYWGAEMTEREFMITLANAARGSHHITTPQSRCLSMYQDNEVWGHGMVDFFLTEHPIHNSGGSKYPDANMPSSYWERISKTFFFDEDCPISLVSRGKALGQNVDQVEWIITTISIARGFGGIDADTGELILAEDKDGRMLTGLDAQMMALSWMEEYPNVLTINGTKHWCDCGFEVYGDMEKATIGSTPNGSTLTSDGSHPNGNGSKVVYRPISPALRFY